MVESGPHEPTLSSLCSLLSPHPLGSNTLSSRLFLKHIRNCPTPGPLHMLSPLPGTLFSAHIRASNSFFIHTIAFLTTLRQRAKRPPLPLTLHHLFPSFLGKISCMASKPKLLTRRSLKQLFHLWEATLQRRWDAGMGVEAQTDRFAQQKPESKPGAHR